MAETIEELKQEMVDRYAELSDEEKDIILKRVSPDQIDEYLSIQFDLPYEKPEKSEDKEGEDGSEDENHE